MIVITSLMTRLAEKDGTQKFGGFSLFAPAASGTNGKRWSSKIVERCNDGEGKPYQPKVTCKACLALTQRWMKDSS